MNKYYIKYYVGILMQDQQITWIAWYEKCPRSANIASDPAP
jgi:hypothetical protein